MWGVLGPWLEGKGGGRARPAEAPCPCGKQLCAKWPLYVLGWAVG